MPDSSSLSSVSSADIVYRRVTPAPWILTSSDDSLNKRLKNFAPWVLYRELSDIVAHSFRDRGVVWPEDSVLGVGCLLDMFAPMRIDRLSGKPLLIWVVRERFVMGEEMPVQNPVVINSMFVRQDFSVRVLSLVSHGIVKVVAERMVEPGDQSNPVLYGSFAYTASGKRFHVQNRRLVPADKT